MTCQELVDFLDAYISGELSADDRAEFERHLGCCPACVVYLNTYRETVRAACVAGRGAEAMADAPPDLIAAILKLRPT
ncbi:MAG TPA: zf-HC2 domain-containing protein, partial [Pirellulales bacterium]